MKLFFHIVMFVFLFDEPIMFLVTDIVNRTMWLTGQPQDNYNCAVIQCSSPYSCGWKAANCSQKYPVICVFSGMTTSKNLLMIPEIIEGFKGFDQKCSFSDGSLPSVAVTSNTMDYSVKEESTYVPHQTTSAITDKGQQGF